MPELDHLVLASPDLDAGVAHVETLTGAAAVPGGPHPGMGSRNALLTFDQATYFEIIALDPDQPDPGRPRPFGLDDAEGPRLVGFAIHPTGNETLEGVAERMGALGADPGVIRAMSRIKPDGEEIHWRLTIGDTSSGRADPVLPFVIDWGETPSPALSLPSMGSLVELRIAHPGAGVRSVIEGLDLGVTVADGPPGLVAVVETPSGVVEIT